MRQDLGYALRQIRKAPLFGAAVVLLMALGISANTVIFTVVDSLLLRPLPVPNPGELVRLIDHHPPIPDSSYFEYSLWRYLREHSTSYKDVMGQAEFTTTITNHDSVTFARVGMVTENYHASLGARAALGRIPAPDELQTAVVSDRYWRTAFLGDRGVIGRSVLLNGHPFTIAAVLAPEFHGTNVDLNPDLRIPAKSATQLIDLPGPLREGFFPYEITARLKPGVTMERAYAETLTLFNAWTEDYAKQFPDTKADQLKPSGELRLQAIGTGVSVLRDQFAGALELLMAGAGLVLLMVCSNVAGLLLERATARESETAVRLALGASTGRLVRQWLTESLLFALFGGAAGIALARVALPVAASLIPPLRDRAGEVLQLDPSFTLDWRVLAFSMAACVASAFLAGLAPALRAARRTELSGALRSTRSASKVERGITVFQVALCTLLLVEAGLFVRTLDHLRTMNAGFDRDHVATFTIQREHASKERPKFWQPLLEEVRHLPGVAAAGYADRGLMRGTGMKTTAGLPGDRPPRSEFMNSSLNWASPEYFDTMAIRIAAGRNFEPGDAEAKQNDVTPVIVNQAFARRFFAGQDAVGKLFGTGAGPIKPALRVIGIVTDARYRSLREPIPPTIYQPLTGDRLGGPLILHVRTSGDPSALIAPVRRLVEKAAPGFAIKEVNLLRDEVERSIWRERLVAQLAIAFALVAVVLAAVGLYGSLAYYVARHRRSIGIRIAIGADAGAVVGLLANRVAVLVGSGVAIGIAGAFAVSRLTEALLYGVAPTDPVSIAAAGLVAVMVAVMSVALPAAQAIRVDPAVALREE